MKPCKRLTVTAIGIDHMGNVKKATNYHREEECNGVEGGCGAIHAEDALLNEHIFFPYAVLLSHSPCLDCAKLLVERHVKVVSYINEYRLTEGIEYLKNNGVTVI